MFQRSSSEWSFQISLEVYTSQKVIKPLIIIREGGNGASERSQFGQLVSSESEVWIPAFGPRMPWASHNAPLPHNPSHLRWPPQVSPFILTISLFLNFLMHYLYLTPMLSCPVMNCDFILPASQSPDSDVSPSSSLAIPHFLHYSILEMSSRYIAYHIPRSRPHPSHPHIMGASISSNLGIPKHFSCYKNGCEIPLLNEASLNRWKGNSCFSDGLECKSGLFYLNR